MIDGFSETQIITGLVAVLATSYAAFFGWLVASIHRLDRKMDERFDKVNERFDKVDQRFARVDERLDRLTVAVSRLEGAVYHGLPEPRKPAVG